MADGLGAGGFRSTTPILVTGGTGFIGAHVASFLREGGHEVHVLGRTRPGARPAGSESGYRSVDLGVAEEVADVLRDVRPRQIYHLAASWQPADLPELLRLNVRMLVNLLDSCLDLSPRPAVLIASSAGVYGRSQAAGVTERASLRPLTANGVIRLTLEIAASRYRSSYGLPVTLARLFNVIGPGERDATFSSSVARQIAELEAEARVDGFVRVGNLTTSRDFLDVRDAASGLVAALNLGRSGTTYNVCSGVATPVSEIVRILREVSRRPWQLRSEPSRFRPDDIESQRGSYARLQRHTGWQPQTPLQETLRQLLDDWRRRVGNTTTKGGAPVQAS
ncbi:MAG: GDP-mannose 4,6-dehydratase [Chloroflexi bacterium]|nr:GDP-mannose 4,6-dehydratase [Chloroflexota bacterium]